MLRVVAKDLSAVIDIDKTASGRGCWVHSQCFELALQRNAFGRALTMGVDCSELKNQFSKLEQAEKSAG